MQIFLELHVESIYGIRFSANNYSTYKKINNYPLYAVAKPFLDVSEQLKKCVDSFDC